jgi:hypothetical protein
VNIQNIQMSSITSSNKVLLEGSGSYTVPNLPGAGDTSGSVTIAHNYGSDNLMVQVQATTDTAGTSGWAMLPWSSGDGRLIQYWSLDANNLYITTNHNDSSGFGYPASTVNYFYRILIP